MQVPIASVDIVVTFVIFAPFTVAFQALSHGKLYKMKEQTQLNVNHSQMHTQKSKQVFSSSSI